MKYSKEHYNKLVENLSLCVKCGTKFKVEFWKRVLIKYSLQEGLNLPEIMNFLNNFTQHQCIP